MRARRARVERERRERAARQNVADANGAGAHGDNEPPPRPPRKDMPISSRYRVIKVLGRGSFGEALRVQRVADKVDFVMKKIDLVGMPKKEQKAAMLEVKVLKKLSHPNIVRYEEAGQERGGASPRLLIVMEYANGGDLSALIKSRNKKRQPLSEKRILRIMIQCMLALGYMHKHHIMHRDIKAANVFLHNTGTDFLQMDIVKLGDFGIAKVLEKTMDKCNTVAGTPYYMSPEICKDQPYTLKSDVWSLGVLFYELALLEVPFNANNLLGLVKKVVSMPPKRIPNTYSREFRQLGEAMLQKSPLRRPDIRHILKRAFIKEHSKSLLEEVMNKSSKAVTKQDRKTPRDQNLKDRMEKITKDMEIMKADMLQKRAQAAQAGEEEERRKVVAAKREARLRAREERAKQKREEEIKAQIVFREEKQMRKEEERKRIALLRQKRREQMQRDRKNSKAKLDKRPSWNNDWHNDEEVEVLVKGESPPRQGAEEGRGNGDSGKRANPVGEKRPPLPPSNYDDDDSGSETPDARELYLKQGTGAFQVDRNPFARQGEFAEATGSAVAAKLDRSMSNDSTSEIQFVAAAAEMPPNQYYGNEQTGTNLQAENAARAGLHNERLYEQQQHREAVLRYREREQRERLAQLTQQQEYEEWQRRQQQQQQQQYHYEQQARSNQQFQQVPQRHHSQGVQYQQQQHSRERQALNRDPVAAGQRQRQNSGWAANQPHFGNPYGYGQMNPYQQDPRAHAQAAPRPVGVTDQDRRSIFEENQRAMLRNKQRVEDGKRRHHPSAAVPDKPPPGLYQDHEGNARGARAPRTRAQVLEEKERIRQAEEAQRLQQLEKARLEAFRDRERLRQQHQKKKPGQPANPSPTEGGPGRIQSNEGQKPPRTRAQMLEEKAKARQAAEAERLAILEKARIEAFEERKRLDMKHKNAHVVDTGKGGSASVEVASAAASTAAVTKALDMTTSIYIDDESDLFPMTLTLGDMDDTKKSAGSNDGVEEMIGLAESLKNLLFANETSNKFFENSSANVPDHDLVRVKSAGASRRPGKIEIAEVDQGNLEVSEHIVGLGMKPVTPLDQSSDSLAVLFRKSRGHIAKQSSN